MSLDGKRILIVEDEGIIAIELAYEVAASGGEVVGPVGTVDKALHVVATADLDGAIIDVDLRGRSGFLVADALAALRVPFVFETGYARPRDVPARHTGVPCLRKPLSPWAACCALEDAMWSANRDGC
jgi:CheY-like chemotaxis protein